MNRRRSSRRPAVLVICAAVVAAAWAQTSFFPKPVEAVVKNHCLEVGCHAGRYPAAGVSLDPDLAGLAAFDRPAQTNPSFKIIDPAEPEKSYLLMKLRGSAGIEGGRMPLRRDPLSEAEIKTIADWLAFLKSKTETAQRLPGGDLRLSQGDFRLGFNIDRLF